MSSPTVRDQKLLGLLNRYQILSTRQIRTHVFSEISPTNMFRRLRILEKRNWIKRSVGLEDGSLAWSLTALGASKIGASSPNIHVNRNTLGHDVLLSELRFALESVGLGEKWIPESELKQKSFSPRTRAASETPVVPDGLMPVKTKDGTFVIAVELELLAKNKARYRQVLRKYAKRDKIKWVWYIAPNRRLMKTIYDEWLKLERYSFSPELILSDLDKVLSDPWNIEAFGLGDQGKMFLRDVVEMHAPSPKTLLSKEALERNHGSESTKNPTKKSDHTPDHSVITQPSEKSSAA